MDAVTLEPEPAPSPRIGDAERDDAVSLLQEHLAAGRIDNAEFNDRLNAALEARTMGELSPLFSDLPGRRPGQALEPAAAASTPATSTRSNEAVRRVGGVVVAALWPAAIIACFATGWSYWWIMLIPIFMTGVIARAFGLGGDDRHRDRERNRDRNRELGR